MLEAGIYEYGLKTGGLPEEEVVWMLYATITMGYPKPMSPEDRILEFGDSVMQEWFGSDHLAVI